MAADNTLSVVTGSLGVTSMRYHELALQAWLNQKFILKQGYPIPVIFASPMDAFTKFQDLWKRDKNPFNYLFDLKDANGTPLYEPHPSTPKYPLLSVMRKGWKYRTYQNFSIHQWRRINWPTVNPNVHREDLGTVTTSFMPMAWDYKFQIDMYSMRPDTQAYYIEKMMREFFRTGGALQTWIPINYPGIGTHLIRMWMEGDFIDWATPDEAETDKTMEFRTTVNVTIEGFSIDVNFQFLPTLWTLVVNSDAVAPADLARINPIAVENLRIDNANPVMESRTDIPSNGTNATLAPTFGQPLIQYISFGTGVPQTPDPTFVVQPSVSYGIASAEAFGVPTVTLM